MDKFTMFLIKSVRKLYCKDPIPNGKDEDFEEIILFRCDKCKQMRPMNKIYVFKHTIKVTGKITGTFNAKYCNDNLSCEKYAKDANNYTLEY